MAQLFILVLKSFLSRIEDYNIVVFHLVLDESSLILGLLSIYLLNIKTVYYVNRKCPWGKFRDFYY